MKKVIFALSVLALLAAGCVPAKSSYDIEQQQQEVANQEIVRNQPPPNLGGYSFERHIVTEVYKARNDTISTYTYIMLQMTGQIVEICPSIGYPIPYSTQITSPERIERVIAGEYVVISNPEPNGLYPPDNAAATIVNCVNPDGSLTPTYWEDNVFALPYRIKADRLIERVDGTTSSFSIDAKK